MRCKFFLFISFLLLHSSISLSQNKCKVYGLILDSLTKNPVVNVNVIIRGTNIGAVTDSTGYFQLDLPVGGKYTIVFSHIAYSKTIRELSLEKYKEVEYKIYLTENKFELPEVSVEGKRSFEDIRALWVVDGSEFEKLGEKNLEKALIYMFPRMVYRLNDRLRYGKDFTLYVNGEWLDTIYLEEISPFDIKYIKIWTARHGIDTAPIGMPLREGSFVMLIVTK